MTIEIQELIIQARVTDGPPQAPTRGASLASLASLGRMEQDRLVEQVTLRVLESLRDERKQQ
ncbi:hypothetical protein J3D48_006216 [Pseudomonas fluorescens]|uniref:DUF5908 family protein n=1 Tax=Pseudomonas fluorescens TaxID=294 RepID=UPI00209CD7E2|nr:DUF5908 family protein [Pseudomonas fluorescens]MCP1489806.1 hypothetical protein [Pseudomonas fluorescens]